MNKRCHGRYQFLRCFDHTHVTHILNNPTSLTNLRTDLKSWFVASIRDYVVLDNCIYMVALNEITHELRMINIIYKK
jgi:hypothetical protein